MTTSVDSQREAEKRRLRVATARSRRRIDRRLRGSATATRRLTHWKTYVQRFPVPALAVALAFGWMLAAGLRPRVLISLLGGRFIRQMSNQANSMIWGELGRFWQQSAPDRDTQTAEGDDHA